MNLPFSYSQHITAKPSFLLLHLYVPLLSQLKLPLVFSLSIIVDPSPLFSIYHSWTIPLFCSLPITVEYYSSVPFLSQLTLALYCSLCITVEPSSILFPIYNRWTSLSIVPFLCIKVEPSSLLFSVYHSRILLSSVLVSRYWSILSSVPYLSKLNLPLFCSLSIKDEPFLSPVIYLSQSSLPLFCSLSITFETSSFFLSITAEPSSLLFPIYRR
jgi:hypothetical protein